VSQAGLFAGADVVFHPGVWSVAGLEELGGGGGCVGGQQLVAPAVEVFEEGQLGAGVGFFAAADDAQVLRSVGQLVTVGPFPQQGGELDESGFVEVTRCSVVIEDGAPGGCGYPVDGGAFPGA
jgi:hypothetical protein